MQIFYAPEIVYIADKKGINSDIYTLNECESHHCVKVLRNMVSDIIYLVDGKGGFYEAKIIDDNPRGCKVQLIKMIKEYGRRKFYLHIAISPPKQIKRFEWFLEKTTEIGIEEITPIITERSERRIINKERLNKIIISAMKQSEKAYLPILNNPPNGGFEGFIKKEFDGGKYIAHCYENNRKCLKDVYKPFTNALIVIGPEGDFTPSEIELARKNNFVEISLSKSRLRTETAGVVACCTVNLING